MNWLGAGLASLVAAAFGAALGGLVHAEARRHGVDAPMLVGVAAGLFAALASTQKSGMRGVLVASIAVWAAAVAEVTSEPWRGALRDLVFFHERLGPGRLVAYVTTALLALYIGSRARPAPARDRTMA